MPYRILHNDTRGASSARVNPEVRATLRRFTEALRQDRIANSLKRLCNAAYQADSNEAGTSAQNVEASSPAVDEEEENALEEPEEDDDEETTEDTRANICTFVNAISEDVQVEEDEDEIDVEDELSAQVRIQSLLRRLEAIFDNNETNNNNNNNTNNTNNNNNNSSTTNNNTEEENGGEQSESGYWLLEENSHSDSNHEDETEQAGTSGNANSPRWTSRWIPLHTPPIVDPSSNDNLADSRRVVQETEAREHVGAETDAIVDRNRLSPVSANSTRYEQPPLFPFSSLRDNQARKRKEESRREPAASSDDRLVQTTSQSRTTTDSGLSNVVSTSALKPSSHVAQSSQDSSHADDPAVSRSASSASLEPGASCPHTNSSTFHGLHSLMNRVLVSGLLRLARGIHSGRLGVDSPNHTAGNGSNDRLSGTHDDAEASGSRATGSEEAGFRGWIPRRPRPFHQIVPGRVDTRQRLSNARMEIEQLRQARQWWIDLQNKLRSLANHVERRDYNDVNQPSASTSTANTNLTSLTTDVPSTSGVTIDSSQSNESAKNYKKTLLANYKRENSETENESSSRGSLVRDDGEQGVSGDVRTDEIPAKRARTEESASDRQDPGPSIVDSSSHSDGPPKRLYVKSLWLRRLLSTSDHTYSNPSTPAAARDVSNDPLPSISEIGLTFMGGYFDLNSLRAGLNAEAYSSPGFRDIFSSEGETSGASSSINVPRSSDNAAEHGTSSRQDGGNSFGPRSFFLGDNPDESNPLRRRESVKRRAERFVALEYGFFFFF